MIRITMNENNPSEALKFLTDTINLKKVDYLVAQPREDNKCDIELYIEAENVTIEINKVFTKDAEGIAAICKLMKLAEFETTVINQVSSMTKIEIFGAKK